MSEYSSKRICICLSPDMLKDIDKLSRRAMDSRSSIIRQAVTEFINKSINLNILHPNKETTALKYEILKENHPYLTRHDTDMINFLFDTRNISKDGI